MEIVEKRIVQLDPAGYECPLTWKEGEPNSKITTLWPRKQQKEPTNDF